ncbi:MAG: 50S ribosomal protein L10, partial [Candidatus Omnitrophota bacterium]
MAEKYGKKVKELMIKEMKGVLSGGTGFVFSNIENIKATDMDALRRKLKLSDSKYFVVKNRIGKIALKEAGLDEFTELLEENKTVGLSVITDDPVKIAKVMVDFAKTNKGLQVTNGYLEGQMLTPEKIKELSQLPGREQLIAMVMCAMNGPLTGFVGVLSGVMRSLCYALNALKEKKE